MNIFTKLFLAITISTLIACGGAEERKAAYMEKAKSSIAAGDLDKARIELKNVLQIDPKDASAYYELGRIFEEKQNFRKAYGNYLKAAELNPDLLVNQARLGRFYILMNDLEKANEKAAFILSKSPDNPDGLLLKAAIKLKKGDINEAISIAKTIVDKEPGHIDGAAFLVTLYMKENKAADAIKVLENSLKSRPDNIKINSLMGSVLTRQKQYDKAEAIYRKILELRPDTLSSYKTLAAFYDLTGEYDKAEAVLRQSIDNNPDDENRKLELIRFISSKKGKAEAIKQLKQLVSDNPGSGKLRLALAELTYLNGDKAAAIEIYKQALSDFSEEVTGIESRIALAKIYIDDKDFISARKVVDEAISISPNDPKVNYLRAILSMEEKDYDQTIISLRIVNKELPDNIEAYIILANTYLLKGEFEQAKKTLFEAYENNRGNADALLKLSRYYAKRDIAQAEKIIDDYNNLKADDYEGLSIKARILNKKKQYREAKVIADTLVKIFPDKPDGYTQSMPYYINKGEKKLAKATLEKGYASVADNNKLLALLTSLNISDKEFDIAEDRIRTKLGESPDNVELKILLAKVYASSGKINEAESLLNEVILIRPEIEDPYLILSQIYQSRKDLEMLQSILEKGHNNVEESLKIGFGLASVYERRKDYERAMNIYRELYTSHPDNLLVVNNLASMLSDYSNKPEDLQFAKRLSAKLELSGQPLFLDTIGWVNYKLGEYEKSIQSLLAAIEMSPDVNIFNYHLGMAYKMTGKKDLARKYLEKSLANGKSFIGEEEARQALKEL